ncbi:MAG: MMPL family transporter [Chloroflexia bacterium]|nr:MMPL family transporter [Chloroflexia bacterium]
MKSFFSTAGMAEASSRRPWWTIGAWVAALVLSFVIMGTLGLKTTTEFTFTNDPESQAGANILEGAGLIDDSPTDETIVVHSETSTVDDPAFQAKVEEITATVRGMDGVVVPDTVVNYYELSANSETAAMAEGLVSDNRNTTLIPASLTGTLDEAMENAPAYVEDVDAFSGDGIEVISVGYVSIGEENNKIAEEDIVQGETVGIIAALIILVFVFGALVAAGIPIILAMVSILISLGITALIGQIWDLSFFVTNMITMIGLAVGIDYALFVVERYREERRRGRTKSESIGVTGGTASKAVAFSGATVVLALLGMFIMPASIFRALAIGAIVVVIVAVFAALTLVPALLTLLGDRIDWPRKRNYEAYAVAHAADDPHNLQLVYKGFWGRITRAVMARPVIGVVFTVGLLLLAAIPYLDINTGFAGVESMPDDSQVKQGFEILEEEGFAGRLAVVQFAVDGDEGSAQGGIDNLRTALAAATVPDGDGTKPAFLPVPEENWARWNDAGDVALLEATLNMGTNDARAYTVIDELRGDIVPAAFDGSSADVYVTGETAFNQDFFNIANDYAPYVIAFVLGLSFLLLLLAFRSIVVSAKAIAMNLLSVGAAYGLLVLVFQKGVGADFFGFQQTPTIEAWIPIFLFCVLFGLSMDYHVFLLSRIREHYDQTGNNTESVAVGLHSTAKIITGAALIMVAVFGGFASGRLVMLQQMGFGLGVAVLLDATIVRSVLVPSAMALLGDRNWYLPKWLEWLPDLRVEGAPPPAPTAPAAVPVEVPAGAAAGE